MPHMTHGFLVEIDTATKIYLKVLNTKNEKFILDECDGDDSCLFINEEKLEYVREEVQKFKRNLSNDS